MAHERPPIYLRLPDDLGSVPKDGYVICVPNDAVPKYRCEWCIVEFCATIIETDSVRRRVDLGHGTACVFLNYENIKIIDPRGRELSDPLWSFKREVTARRGKVLKDVTVMSPDNDEFTVRGYLVGEFFAVHRPVCWVEGDRHGIQDKQGLWWVVTHLKSKMTAAIDIRGRTLATAIVMTLECMPIPWSSAEPMQSLDRSMVQRLKVIAQSNDLTHLRDVMLQQLLGC